MFIIDVPRTQLLVSSIIAGIAILGTCVSVAMVAWQLKHRNRLETKKVEEDHLKDLLRSLDKPLDLALSNVMEVDYLRAANPESLSTPEKLHLARPELMLNSRNAYQEFTNVASTIITILPACRRRRGILPSNDPAYTALSAPLVELVEAYEQLSIRYGNAAVLIQLNIDHFLKDPRQQRALNLVAQVRQAASELLAQLYTV